MQAGPTDAELIAASVDNPERFSAIFERHYEAVFRYAAQRVGRNHANDVVSEVFLIAFRQRGRFDARLSTSARPWLFGIALNLIRRRARARARRFRAFGRAAPAPHVWPSEEVEDRVDAERRMASLNEALGQLQEIDRETLLLYGLTDLTYQEVASILDIPVGTVRSRLARARAHIVNHLTAVGEYWQEEQE